MFKRYFANTMMSASSTDACFAMSSCLIMMGTASVSIIFSIIGIIGIIGLLLSILVILLIMSENSRKRTAAVNA